ncbi:MAG: hypothetical protein JO367_20895 [Actinobacteria bacterium]|nr:hypothetical protein [Actinomycetota bacterium]
MTDDSELPSWREAVVVGAAVRLRGDTIVDGRVTRFDPDGVYVEDARLGQLVLRPRHEWLRVDGVPVSKWTICNVVADGSIVTIASDLAIQPDGSVQGVTSI